MKKIIYLFPISLVFLVACNNSTQKEEKHETTEMNKEAESNHQHEKSQPKVQLDNGKKWKANPETITGINNMLGLVQDGIDGKKELATLHEPLQLEFKTIFEKCTMKGESHDQLHNFLLPLKDELAKFKEVIINAEYLKEMKEYLLTFKNYFE